MRNRISWHCEIHGQPFHPVFFSHFETFATVILQLFESMKKLRYVYLHHNCNLHAARTYWTWAFRTCFVAFRICDCIWQWIMHICMQQQKNNYRKTTTIQLNSNCYLNTNEKPTFSGDRRFWNRSDSTATMFTNKWRRLCQRMEFQLNDCWTVDVRAYVCVYIHCVCVLLCAVCCVSYILFVCVIACSCHAVEMKVYVYQLFYSCLTPFTYWTCPFWISKIEDVHNWHFVRIEIRGIVSSLLLLSVFFQFRNIPLNFFGIHWWNFVN